MKNFENGKKLALKLRIRPEKLRFARNNRNLSKI